MSILLHATPSMQSFLTLPDGDGWARLIRRRRDSEPPTVHNGGGSQDARVGSEVIFSLGFVKQSEVRGGDCRISASVSRRLKGHRERSEAR